MIVLYTEYSFAYFIYCQELCLTFTFLVHSLSLSLKIFHLLTVSSVTVYNLNLYNAELFPEEVLAGTEILGGGETGRLRLMLHCHHLNDTNTNMDSAMKAVLMRL